MDINDSSYTRFKTNKPGITRSSSGQKTDATVRVKGSGVSPAQNNQPVPLKEGQIIRGQIIDHRLNEVKVQLEPWNQVVTAKLSGDVPLSIGQEANFQVTGNTEESLVLKYVPKDTNLSSDIMIQKALTASNLSMTDKNKALVLELLNNNMPIDKQTLQLLTKLSYTNREASPLTLVLMLKNNIPMTPENIRQFEAYQNGTHQLLNDIRTIAGNLTRLITQPGNFTNDISISTGLLSETQYGSQPTGNPVLSGNTPLGTHTTPAAESNTSNNTIQVMEDSLEMLATGQNSSNPIHDQSKVLTDSYQAINKLIKISGKLIQELMVNETITEASDDANSAAALQSQNTTTTEASTLKANSVISDQLMNTSSSAVLSDFLNFTERSAIVDYMKSFPDPAGLKKQISDGTAPLEKVLSFIQESLSQSEKDTAGKLLGSPEYTKLLENAFIQKWTITPDKLAKKAPISDLYKNLQADMEELSHLIKAGSNSDELLQLREPVKNLQENLQFMKDLNEAFTYIQLPVRLKDKQLHSDLYVFTRKKSLQEKPDSISVLLHLDMDHLGPLNVHISLYQQNIQAKFYMADSEAEQLIKTNMSSLSQVLSKKGYQLSSEVICNYKQPDFSRDFIEENIGDGDIKRYTFDIRT